MSLPAIIDLPSPLLREGIHYTTQLLSAYLRLTNPTQIREDVAVHGYYLAKGEDSEHEARTLEKLKDKLNIILSGEVEKRKNSWTNNLSYNLLIGNNRVVASMITSLWRRLLLETSLKKAEKSAYGYALNGNLRSKSIREKETKALCEWCSQEITVPVDKGFTCPHCNTYFADFKPQKVKIKPVLESFYFDDFEQSDEKNVLKKIQIGEFELKKAKKANAGQLAFSFAFGLGA